MKINIEKVKEIFTSVNLPGTNEPVYTTSEIERGLIETTLYKMVNTGKLNRIEKSLLKDYGILGKKSK